MGKAHVKATRVGQYDSRLEAAYADRLDILVRAGEIVEWKHKAIRLRIGASGEKTQRAFYSPDFTVLRNDLTLEHHETKGRWMEAAKVRIRVAAEMYPWFGFLAVQKDGDGFKYERFG